MPCRLSRLRSAELLVLFLLGMLPLVSSDAFMDSASVKLDPGVGLIAGNEFGVEVLGGNFDPQNDKVMLVPHGATCGLAVPAAGSPGSVSGYADISCAHGGSAASRLVCRGFRVYAAGMYKVCVCDADGNVTKVLPQLVNPETSGCQSVERYFLSTTVGSSFEMLGPDHRTYDDDDAWRAGANEHLWIYGRDLSSSDRVRIIDDSRSCHNGSHSKTNHEAVSGNIPHERSVVGSGSRVEKWDNVRISKVGTYRVCWCGQNPDGCDSDARFVVHTATIFVSGPLPAASPLLVVTGVPFGITLNGQGLSPFDRIMLIFGAKECGKSQPTSLRLQGAVGQRDAGSSDFSKWDGVVLDGSSTIKICWCGAMSVSCTNCCQTDEEFNIWAGNITVGGPQLGRYHRAPLGKPFTYAIEGWGLSTDDRISIVDYAQMCNTDGAQRWSDGVYRSVDQIGQPPKDTVGDDPYNMTYQAWPNIVLKSMRTYRVCWCARNVNDCRDGTNFALTIGRIVPTGPRNLSSAIHVVPGLPFALTLNGEQGSKFSIDDRVRIVRQDVVLGVCGNSGTRVQADEVAETVCWPNCTYSPISEQPALLDSNETESWSPTKLTGSGTFLICWCPDGYNGCDHNEDFMIQAGVLVSAGVEQGLQWKCAAFIDCKIYVPHPEHLGNQDVMQLISGASVTQCGITLRAEASLFTRGSRINAVPVTHDGHKQLEFSVGSPKITGSFKVCYCQNVAGCQADSDFFQEAGVLTISGVSSIVSTFVCYTLGRCTLRVNGYELTAQDTVVLNSLSSTCGSSGTDTSRFNGHYVAGTDGSKRYAGTFIGMDQAGMQVWDFHLGQADDRTANYRLCFCSSGLASSYQCRTRSTHAQQVGELYVRGTDQKVDRTCSQGLACVFKLRSTTFSTQDRVMLIDENSTCGDVNAKYPDWLTPIAPFSIDPDQQQPTLKAASFRIEVAIPGKWRVCYCASMHGAVSCLKSNDGRRLSVGQAPNMVRYGLDAGKVVIQGYMKEIRTLPDLPSTKQKVSVLVDMVATGSRITCVATKEHAPDGFVPLTSDLQNCGKALNEITARQRLFPRCVGIGRTRDQTNLGWNLVHIPVVTTEDKLYVWCYPQVTCQSDRCVLPPDRKGKEVSLTTGLTTWDNRWSATVNTAFPLSVELTPSYTVNPTFARIKIIKAGEDCNREQLYPGVKPMTCVLSAVGKCEPGPREFLSGAKRELVWDNIIVPRGGDYTVCYCDRHYNQACDFWRGIGTLTAKGPLYAGQARYVGNPGKPIKIPVKGRGLALTNRLRIVPQEIVCNAFTAEHILTGQPSQFNSTYEVFDVTINQKGKRTVCWCGGDSVSCTEHQHFTVTLGPLEINDKSDCVLSEWWVVDACSEPCGGGTQSLRRGITAQPTGGGQECPSENQLRKTQECNTDPCALARVDRVWTVPAQIREMDPFQIHVSGHSFNPKEDKILLVDEQVTCGASTTHFGGADCYFEGSDKTLLVCGDGVGSIRLSKAGRFKVCVCDASAAVVSSFDGSAQISTGSLASKGMPGAGCSSPNFFQLTPPATGAAIITVLQALSKSSEEETGGTSAIIIALIASVIALLFCACVGVFLYLRMRTKTKTLIEDDWEDEEKGDASLVENREAPPLQALPAPYNYYPQYDQMQQMQQMAAMQALAAPPPMMALANGLEPPPPTPYGPLALTPPPSMPPPKLSMPPALSPRLNTSPRLGSGKNMKKQKTFSDLVNEAKKASPARSFSQMNLTPWATPTNTPRDNESTTPRGGGTPRGTEAENTLLAIEDNRPETAESDMPRPLSTGSVFNSTTSSWRPSTADSENRPWSSGSTLSDFSSVSTHQPLKASEPSHSPVPKLPLIPAMSSGSGPLPGIEEHPHSANSKISEDQASLALSESTVGGGMENNKSRRSVSETSPLTQSALKAHDTAIEEEGVTPRTDGGSTPKAILSIFGGMGKIFGSGRKSKEKVGESITPGRNSWVSDESGNSAKNVPPAPKRDSNKTFPLPPESEPAKLEAPPQPPEPIISEKLPSPPQSLASDDHGNSKHDQSAPNPPETEAIFVESVAPPQPPELQLPPDPPEIIAPISPEMKEEENEPLPEKIEDQSSLHIPPPPETGPTPPCPPVSEVVDAPPTPKFESPPSPPAPEIFEMPQLHEEPPPPPEPVPEVSEVPQVHEQTSPPKPPVPEVFETPEWGTLREQRAPPEPPAPEIVETPKLRGQPPPPPKPPVPEVLEVSPRLRQPPPPPKPQKQDSPITREGMPVPPSQSLFRPSKTLPGRPESPLSSLETTSTEGPPQPPPPPRSPKSTGRPSIGPGPSLDPQHGNHRSGHSLHHWAKELNHPHEKQHSHEPDAPAPIETPPPSPPPPPPKPSRQSASRGPGPALTVDTDNLEDTIRSIGSNGSSKGSPGGKKAFSLGGMARTAATLPRPQNAEAKAKSRPSTAIGPRDQPQSHSKPEGMPTPPPLPRNSTVPSPKAKAAW